MIFAFSQSSQWPIESLGLFGVAVIAAVGGLLVLVGVFMEIRWEKSWYKTAKDFHRSESIRRIGGWLVVAGLVWEVLFGAALAIADRVENKNTKAAIASADTRNLPINTISGYAIVEVRAKGEREINLAKTLRQILKDKSGINFDLNVSDRMRQNPEPIELFFGEFPNESPSNPPNSIFTIGWIDSLNTVVDDSKPYVPNLCFVLSFDSGNFWNPDALTFNNLKFVQIGGLGRNGEIESPMEVISGKIVLKANRDWSKEFSFPKQKNQFFRVSSFETNGIDIPAGYGNLTNEPAGQ